VKILLLVFLITYCSNLFGQSTFPVNGVHDQREDLYAFINATIVKDYQTKLDKATLVIKEGKILNVGKGVEIPKGAIVIDLKGKFIYPSFIDMYTQYGLPRNKKKGSSWSTQIRNKQKGAYGWNQSLKSHFEAFKSFRTDTVTNKTFRDIGFGAVLSHRKDGVARGSSVLVVLGNNKENKLIVKDEAAAHYSFRKGTSKQDYPGSLMGSIALLRQTYLDGRWYKTNSRKEYNISLERWNELQSLPQIFEVGDLQCIILNSIQC